MTVLRQVVATSVVLALGGLAGFGIYLAKPEAQTRPQVKNEPLVRISEAHAEAIGFRVASQGSVRARTESTLVAEVTGRVLEVTPAFEVGAFFEKDALLARIEDVDYQLDLVRARADIAAAMTALAQQEAEAATAIAEWKRENGDRAVPPLVAREPQLEEARARVAATKALEARSKRDLDRTEIRAPYRGRVRSRAVDRGGYVGRGTPMGMIYAVDWAEVRLPLTPDDLAFVDLPSGDPRDTSAAREPLVELRADIAGKSWTWRGRVVRTEGEIDPRSRMIHAIARIEDPYGAGDAPPHPPLAVGQFVEAEIFGKTIPGLYRVPRSAMREGNRVLLERDGRIESRAVNIVRRERDTVLLDSGLADGDRVVVSPLEVWTDGMAVRVDADANAELKR